ncbi:prepilin-type N-terminal cleavage/methylation domain-containing protein [Microcella sp.]|uniref:type IV pilus modification PilV family protein n=1 Tax=Microcella sp. TaxID=1913979 RepID=UPI00391B1E7C
MMKSDDRGFGLVEVVVSMFLLTLLAVAFLPLLIESLRITVRNATIATATQVLSEQLDTVQVVDRTCAAYAAWAAQSVAPITDERQSNYRATRSVTGCAPSMTFPATVTVTVSVDVTPDTDVRVQATTLAIVERAN